MVVRQCCPRLSRSRPVLSHRSGRAAHIAKADNYIGTGLLGLETGWF